MEPLHQLNQLRHLDEQFARAMRRERVFQDRANPFEMHPEDFRRRYRFTKETVRYIIELIEVDIRPVTKRSHAIQADLQVLITLRFFATGAFQMTIGDVIHIHQSTVSRIVRRVSVALARLKSRFVQFPQGRRARVAMAAFHDIADFPRVVSAIDCTHIKISNPGGEDAQRYFNRKHFFSLNCQFTCDSAKEFTSVVARWPGSSHDSRIFRECQLKERFETNDLGGIMLGDGGYGCLPYLMTPVKTPRTAAETAYNRAHCKTRTVIEQAFGMLKRRFPILHYGLRLKLTTVYAVIIAITVLHNIALGRREQDFENEDLEDQEDADYDDFDAADVDPIQVRYAERIRRRIIQQFE